MSYIEDNNSEEYVNSVINNLKKILGVTSDRQLPIRLDIKPPSFANTIKRGLLPYEKIVLFAKKHNQSLDKIFLLQNQNYIVLISYVLLSIILGIIAVILGFQAAGN